MALAKMTLIGLINYYDNVDQSEDTLFDNLNLPEGIDKNTVINNIIMKGGEFPILYPNAPYVRAYIGVWSNKWYRTFDKWYAALNLNYNPLHNYDRIENITDDITTSGSKTGSTTDGTTINETVKNTGDVTKLLTYNSDLSESKSGSDTSTKTDNLSEDIEREKDNSIQKHNLQDSHTNGVVTQSADTTNRQTRNETTTNNGATTTHNVSAYNSNTPVFDSSDSLTGGSTTTISYSGNDPDNVTTTTSVAYSGFNGDTIENTGSDTGTESESISKSNTGTSTNETEYDSTINHEKRGSDTDKRTDNLTQTTTNTISGTGSVTDTTSGTNNKVHEGNIEGSTGIFSKQNLLSQELQLAEWNLYDHIADIFIDSFCIKIY